MSRGQGVRHTFVGDADPVRVTTRRRALGPGGFASPGPRGHRDAGVPGDYVAATPGFAASLAITPERWRM
ncbi:MAG: hypothetical protein HIU57_08825 [Acidobacteria bacterium]|nr:hypothetical protein [Acidobacteriota bacterium]